MTEIFQRKSLALIEAASFFDEERGEKDRAESRFPAPRKTKKIRSKLIERIFIYLKILVT